MQTFITFLPIVLFAVTGTLLFFSQKINFDNQAIMLSVALLGHIALSVVYGYWLYAIIQIVAAIIIFLLMVFVLGGKISGETMLTMSALIALTPPKGLLSAVAVIVAFVIIAFIQLKRQSESIKATLFEAVNATGMGHSLPNYDNLPNRADLDASAKRTSLLPYMAVIMTVTSMYYLIRPLFLDV